MRGEVEGSHLITTEAKFEGWPIEPETRLRRITNSMHHPSLRRTCHDHWPQRYQKGTSDSVFENSLAPYQRGLNENKTAEWGGRRPLQTK